MVEGGGVELRHYGSTSGLGSKFDSDSIHVRHQKVPARRSLGGDHDWTGRDTF